MKRLLLCLALAFAWPLTALAEEAEQAIRATFAERLPAYPPDTIAPTAIPGLYQVLIGGQVVYASADGRYVLQGRLLDIVSGEDLTEPALRGSRVEMIGQVPESQMVIFEPRGEVRHTLTTFTDVDCAYCRKLHAEMEQLNERGVRVRYLLYPRTGVGSPSYRKAVGVWCADDRNAAMTRAKRGEAVPSKVCDNPVEAHMALATKLGLTGTPFTITDTGEKIAGYAPVDQLVKRLDASKAALAKAN